MLVEQEHLEVLGKKLVERGSLTSEQLANAVQKAQSKGVSLLTCLIDSKALSKTVAYEALAEVYGTPFVDLSNFEVSPDAVQAVPMDLAHRYKAIPIFKIGNTLNVVMENPTDVTAVDQLTQKTQCEIAVCLGSPEDIQDALREYYGISNTITQLLTSLEDEKSHRAKGADDKKGRLRPEMSAKGYETRPVVSLVDMMFQQAYEEGASDIHLEPEEKIFRVRYRVDGVLHEALTPPKYLESEIISRIKVLAGMDIAEARLPQDGRIKITIKDKPVEMRVSSMPTVNGENIVLRILKDPQEVLDLSSLGFSDEMRKVFEGLIKRPYGMILETGPTGCGKTTTLYAALRMINSMERNIVTIEDPVEYRLPMLRQIAVNPKAGLNFATALRNILRQDPDVIMVGEIRDRETAEIAIQAALTGHLVFSTLHTNNAVNVITRLVDMKIEPFLVAASIAGVLSQRLVRRLCPKCKTEDKPSEIVLKTLRIQGPSFPMFKSKGCRFCHHTGYKGRVGIFELFKIDEAIQSKIVARANLSEIEEEARRSGFKSMLQDSLEKMKAGLTTAEEVMKAVDLG